MKNNLLTLVGVMLIATIAASPAYANNSAHAKHKGSFVNYARVTSVEPIYKYITIREPKRHCSYVTPSHRYNRHRQQRRFVSGEYYGGNRIAANERRNDRQFRNQGHNQAHNQSRNNGHNQNRRVKHCVTTTVARQERHHDGYSVTYVYHGHRYQTRTDYHPGDRIKITVDIRPH